MCSEKHRRGFLPGSAMWSGGEFSLGVLRQWALSGSAVGFGVIFPWMFSQESNASGWIRRLDSLVFSGRHRVCSPCSITFVQSGPGRLSCWGLRNFSSALWESREVASSSSQLEHSSILSKDLLGRLRWEVFLRYPWARSVLQRSYSLGCTPRASGETFVGDGSSTIVHRESP